MRITVAQFSQEIEAGYHGTGIRISKSTNQPNACVSFYLHTGNIRESVDSLEPTCP